MFPCFFALSIPSILGNICSEIVCSRITYNCNWKKEQMKVCKKAHSVHLGTAAPGFTKSLFLLAALLFFLRLHLLMLYKAVYLEWKPNFKQARNVISTLEQRAHARLDTRTLQSSGQSSSLKPRSAHVCNRHHCMIKQAVVELLKELLAYICSPTLKPRLWAWDSLHPAIIGETKDKRLMF